MPQLDGIHFMLPTPFDDDGAVDEESFGPLVDCAARAGCRGVVCLGVMGEAARLNDAERRQVVRRVVAEAGDRLTVTVGTTAPGTDVGVQRAREAAGLGATALMVSPPAVAKHNLDSVFAYFEGIAAAVDIDIVAQDYPAQSGVFMPPAFIHRLEASIPNVRWLKLEDPPTPPKVTAVKALVGDTLGVFGGLGGTFLLEELRRGACGTMTGFAFPEVLVETYRLTAAGRHEEAAAFFYRYLPLIRYEGQEGIGLSIRKEAVKRRGLLKSERVRHPGAPLDATTRQELFALTDSLDIPY